MLVFIVGISCILLYGIASELGEIKKANRRQANATEELTKQIARLNKNLEEKKK